MSDGNATISRSRLLGARKKRAWEIDFLRGLCIFLVVMDHSMLDFWNIVPSAANWKDVSNVFFVKMEEIARGYWVSHIRAGVVRPIVVFTFVFLSGISCTFSRSNQDRFFKLAAAASAVTLVTYFAAVIIMPGIIIAFGILHIMALNVLVYMLVKKIFPHRAFYFAAGVALTFCGLMLPKDEHGRLPDVAALELSQLWPWVLVGVLFLLYQVRKAVQRNISKNKLDPGTALTVKIVSAAGMSAILAAFILGFLFFFPEAAIAKPVGGEEIGQFLNIVIGTASYGSDFYGMLPYTGMFLIGVTAGEVFYKEPCTLAPVLADRPMGTIGLTVFGAVLGAVVGGVLSFMEGMPPLALLSLLFGAGFGLVCFGIGTLYERLSADRESAKKKIRRPWYAAVSFMGRKAIWVYLIHQVAVLVIILLSAMAVGYRFF